MKLAYSSSDVERWRDKTYRRSTSLAVNNERQALAFVNGVGFCLASKFEGMELPNLWDAVTSGDKADGRKDDLTRNYYLRYAGQIQNVLPNHTSVYYGKVFKRRPSIVSREYFTYFFALSERTGARDEYKTETAHGKLSVMARAIMDLLMKNPPMTSKELHVAFAGRSKGSIHGFEKGLDELQRKMFITRLVGSDNQFASAWAPVIKCFPAEVRKARKISVELARYKLLEKYVQLQLISSIENIHKVFGWSKKDIFHTLGQLIHAGVITTTVALDGKKGKHYCLIH